MLVVKETYSHELIALMLGILGIAILGLRAGGKISILTLFLSYRLLSVLLVINCSVYWTRLYYEKKVLSKPIKFSLRSIFFACFCIFLLTAFYGMMDFLVIAFG